MHHWFRGMDTPDRLHST